MVSFKLKYQVDPIVGQGSSGSNMFANGTGYTFATVNLADVYSDNSL